MMKRAAILTLATLCGCSSENSDNPSGAIIAFAAILCCIVFFGAIAFVEEICSRCASGEGDRGLNPWPPVSPIWIIEDERASIGLIDPARAGTIPELAEIYEETLGHPMTIEPGVLHYVNLFNAAGIRTASSCEGHKGGRPWVLVDGTCATDEEIMDLLRVARLDDDVEIEDSPPYEGLDFDYFEKRIKFPRRHSASEEES